MGECNEQDIQTCKQQPDYSAVFKMVLKDSVALDQLPKDVLEQPKWCLDLLTCQAVKLAVSYEPYIPGSLTAPAVRGTQYMVHKKGQYAAPNAVNGLANTGSKKSKKASNRAQGILEDAVGPSELYNNHSGSQHRDSILPRSSSDSIHSNGSNHGNSAGQPGDDRRSILLTSVTQANTRKASSADRNTVSFRYGSKSPSPRHARSIPHTKPDETNGGGGGSSTSTQRGSTERPRTDTTGTGVGMCTTSTDTGTGTSTNTDAPAATPTAANVNAHTSTDRVPGQGSGAAVVRRGDEGGSGDGEDNMNFLEGSPPTLVPSDPKAGTKTKTQAKSGRKKGSAGDVEAVGQDTESLRGYRDSQSSSRRSIEASADGPQSHQHEDDANKFELSHCNPAKPNTTHTTRVPGAQTDAHTGTRYVTIEGNGSHSEQEDGLGVLGSSLPIDIPIRATVQPSFETPRVDEDNDRQKPTDIARSMHALVAMNNQMYGHLPSRSRKYSVL
ncbi:hypothetical protein SARC_08690 [Sphaeroforma arctica JP610]|uniref:Uncharacterized protein n=1 Tax=Sphaeroforma arctica JP610 TaxID=667725 RepID=A0A0L0FQS3_9EUKA|nr:hypothetical protein SARC_08690 [Sphaeroforma arctica JP610]KNC78896.1 hypothetical protein SARC_08690 [Sphaeroforma arctica JP610]|eukprot:XP_014152798.1 hypothetical protein SARC_08690 [Sphaeroforma arctica JP610]